MRYAHEMPAEAWIDELDDRLLGSGELARLIHDGHVQGLTSNPSILEAAFARAVDGPSLLRRYRCSPRQIYEEVAYEWIVAAADLFRPVYERSLGQTGYVSIELPPALAANRRDTVRAASELARTLDRPNVMIKTPGTAAGLAATGDLIALGIPVNVTLLFAPLRFDAVATAYLDGVSRLSQSTTPPACVASFFVSRIDTAVDRLVRRFADGSSIPGDYAVLLGTAALSCADATWARYLAFVHEHARPHRAQSQLPRLRLLWASTSVKDKEFAPLKYVSALMRPGTVTTMPRATLDLWNRGDARELTNPSPPELGLLRARLQDANIDLDEILARLEQDGLIAFEESFERMLNSLGSASALAE